MKSKFFLTVFLLQLTTTLTFAVHNSSHKADNAKKDTNGIKDQTAEKGSSSKQALNRRDLNITKKVRAELATDQTLSSGARDIKIVTSSEQITLTGTVRSEAEKMKIESAAKKHADSKALVNELQISKQ